MKPNEMIKKYRTKLRFTQQEMADKLYIAVNTYSQYETGKRSMEAGMFLKIMETLGLDFFFEEKDDYNQNETVIDIYLSLKEQLKEYHFHNFSIVHMAYRIDEIMSQEDIDTRWKDYVEVHVPDDLESVYVTVEHKTIDFDKKGRVTGGGTMMRRSAPPWEIKKIDDTMFSLIKESVEKTVKVMGLPLNEFFLQRMTVAIDKELKEIKEQNFHWKYMGGELGKKLAYLIRRSFFKIANEIEKTGDLKFPFEEYLKKVIPDMDKMDITILKTEYKAEMREFKVGFKIKEVGFFSLTLIHNPNGSTKGWHLWDVWHRFDDHDFVCPYCKSTYDGLGHSSRCFPLCEDINVFYDFIKDRPEVKRARLQVGIENVVYRKNKN